MAAYRVDFADKTADWRWCINLLEHNSSGYRLQHDIASIGQVRIPSNRADRPTLVQALKHYILRRSDQHAPLLATALARQTGSINISADFTALTSNVSIKPGISQPSPVTAFYKGRRRHHVQKK